MPVLAALLPAAIGAYQSIAGGIKAHKAQKALEDMQTPTYQPSQAVKQYYGMALNKAIGGTYTTDYYKNAQQNANTSLQAGLGALTDRGSAIGGVSRLIGVTNHALGTAAGNAERIQQQNLQRLGQASSMQAGQDLKSFQYNQQAPFEKNYNLLAQKASAGNQELSSGIQNLSNGINSFGAMKGAQSELTDEDGNNPYNFWGMMKKPKKKSVDSYSGMIE